jgi:hypothetical protein
MISQHFFKKRPLKPFGPGALSLGICFITPSISSFNIGAARLSRLILTGIKDDKSKSILGYEVTPILSL